MKKTVFIFMIIAASLAFTGCGQKPAANLQKQGDDAPKGLQVKENNSLLGWMKKGKAVECRVNSPEGEVVMITKGNRVRMEGVPYLSPDSSGEAPMAANGVMLASEDWTYMWDKANKKGTKMDNRKMKELAGETNQPEPTPGQGDWENMVKQWEAAQVGYDCKEANVSDELFAEPNDVEFMDLTEMLSGIAEIGSQFDAQIQAGEEPDLKALEGIADRLKKQGVDGLNTEDIEMTDLE